MSRIALAGLSVTAMAAGCGDDVAVDDTVDSAEVSSDVRWSQELLSPDAAGWVASAVGEGVTVVLAGGESAPTTAWVSSGSEFTAASFESSESLLSLHDVVATEGGFLAVGAFEESQEEPVLWHSATGQSWSIVDTDGLDGPADVSSLTSHGDVLWAGGVLRNPDDPGSGPFRMAIWRSTDGTSWEAVDPVADPGESWINRLVATSAGLFVEGGLNGESGSWQSTDGALTWTPISTPADASIYQVVERDGTLVGFGRTGEAVGKAPALFTSIDQGATWTTTEVANQLLGPATLAATGGGFWAAGSRARPSYEYWDLCWIDLEACYGSPNTPVLLHSADGFDWTEVSTDFLPEDVTDIWSIAVNETETLLLTGRPRVEAFGWPTDTAPRSASDVAPAPAAIPFIPSDGSLQVGTTYRVMLSTHCGLDYLERFNDTYWHVARTGVPLPSGGADEPRIRHYDQESEILYALITLVDSTSGDLTDPTTGELLARYEASSAEPPPCA